MNKRGYHHAPVIRYLCIVMGVSYVLEIAFVKRNIQLI